jgi:hypothetical protein
MELEDENPCIAIPLLLLRHNDLEFQEQNAKLPGRDPTAWLTILGA